MIMLMIIEAVAVLIILMLLITIPHDMPAMDIRPIDYNASYLFNISSAEYIKLISQSNKRQTVALFSHERTGTDVGKAQAVPGIPAPEERTPGNFYISIKEIQRNKPEITSKQVLQQFIRKGGFHTIEIICGHVPPWLEVEAADGGLTYEAEQLGRNEIKVKIVKNAAGS
jgi:hypothetical protein